jgi:hypothetical protein
MPTSQNRDMGHPACVKMAIFGVDGPPQFSIWSVGERWFVE